MTKEEIKTLQSQQIDKVSLNIWIIEAFLFATVPLCCLIPKLTTQSPKSPRSIQCSFYWKIAKTLWNPHWFERKTEKNERTSQCPSIARGPQSALLQFSNEAWTSKNNFFFVLASGNEHLEYLFLIDSTYKPQTSERPSYPALQKNMSHKKEKGRKKYA